MSNAIIIDLNDDNYTKSFGTDELLQQNAQELFKTRLKTLLGYASNYKAEKLDRRHNTLLINGKRGSGKTSFMLSMKENALSNNDEFNKLEFLEIIDPTLVESKENLFINILSLINQKVNCLRKDSKPGKFQDFDDILNELADGLNVLDGVGSNPLSDFDDGRIILEEGLNRAKGGQNLEKNFHLLIKESLKLIDKSAFVLVFDDIDTSVEHGKTVLELIRKYLTTPQLIVILLGDMDLYSLIVREMQWNKMRPELTYKFQPNNPTLTKLYNSEIDHLINQYLVKIIRPSNRINLQCLNEIKDSVSVIPRKGNEIPLIEYMDRYISQPLFAESNVSIRSYYNSKLLNYPVRSIISIMQTDSSSDKDDEYKRELLNKFRFSFLDEISSKYRGISGVLETFLSGNLLQIQQCYVDILGYLSLDRVPDSPILSYTLDLFTQNSEILSFLCGSHINYYLTQKELDELTQKELDELTQKNGYARLLHLLLSLYLPYSWNIDKVNTSIRTSNPEGKNNQSDNAVENNDEDLGLEDNRYYTLNSITRNMILASGKIDDVRRGTNYANGIININVNNSKKFRDHDIGKLLSYVMGFSAQNSNGANSSYLSFWNLLASIPALTQNVVDNLPFGSSDSSFKKTLSTLLKKWQENYASTIGVINIRQATILWDLLFINIQRIENLKEDITLGGLLEKYILAFLNSVLLALVDGRGSLGTYRIIRDNSKFFNKVKTSFSGKNTENQSKLLSDEQEKYFKGLLNHPLLIMLLSKESITELNKLDLDIIDNKDHLFTWDDKKKVLTEIKFEIKSKTTSQSKTSKPQTQKADPSSAQQHDAENTKQGTADRNGL